MSLVLPQPENTLGSANHALMHRVVAINSDSPEQSVVVNADGSVTLIGAIRITGALYFGDPAVNGNWRIIPSGNNLSTQVLQGGVWTEKSAVTP